MKKKYFITGGLGFVGYSVTKSLLEQGHQVVVLDNNFRNKNYSIKHNNLRAYKGDIRNILKLKKITKGIDSIIHLAAINGTKYFYEKSELVLDVGVKGIINVIDACKTNNIKEIFIASSSEVYQDPPNYPTNEKVRMIIPDPHNPRFSYSASKIISELLVLNSNFFNKAIIFRPHNIYGPNMGVEHVIPELIIKTLKAKKNILIQGTGINKRSFCFIDDFVHGLNILLKKGKHKEIYNIGNDEEINILKLTKLIISILKKDIKIKKSKKIFYNAKRRLPDLSKLKKLGYNPKIDLKNGLLKTVNWYKEQI